MSALSPNLIARKKGNRSDRQTWEYTYLVQTTDLADGPSVALAAVTALLPPSGYRLTDVDSAHRQRNPLWFQVVAIYERNTAGVEGDDPLARPSILTGSWEEWTEAYFIDADDKLVVNFAGDRFEDFLQRKRGSMVLQITKNLATFPAPTYDAIKFTTNSVAETIRGTIYPIDTLLFLPPTVNEQYETVGETEFHYYATTFRLAADEAFHQHTIEQRGYQQLVGDPAEKLPILDDAGEPVAAPWPLNSDGTAKAIGAAADVEAFRPYERANWGIDFS